MSHSINGTAYVENLRSEFRVLGQERNRTGEEFYVCLKEEDKYRTIILKSEGQRHPVPKMILRTEHSSDSGEEVLKIVDILVGDKNRANGSILMKYLFEVLKESSKIKKITGSISDVDRDHFDRIEHFYKKHGFSVHFYTNEFGERTGGCIEKELGLMP